MIVVVMGVSGCGKSTVGELLARRLGLPSYDADEFHPPENVRKMASGQPLTDDDRRPWLETLARAMAGWEASGGAVLACSALKGSYREVLRGAGAEVRFVYLRGDRDTIAERMKHRRGHYMPLSLLDSQFAALEEPADAIVVDIDGAPEEIVERVVEELSC